MRVTGSDLYLTIDSEQHKAKVNSVSLVSEDAGFKTVDQRQDWRLNINAAQDMSEGSLWSLVWDSEGSEVDFVFAPYGNTDPTADKPHFTGTVFIDKTPDAGFEVDTDSTYEVSWKLVARPQIDRGGSASV